MTEALYPAAIVEHDRHPHHAGTLADATHAASADNPLCGDEVTVQLAIEGGRVRAIAFAGRGCALSRAAASMMTDRVLGAAVDELPALAAAFARFVAEPVDAPEPPDLGELAAFAGLRGVRARRTCATLPFRALVAALTTAAPGTRG